MRVVTLNRHEGSSRADRFKQRPGPASISLRGRCIRSLCSGEREAALAEVGRSVAMAIFGVKFDAASRTVSADRYSNSEAAGCFRLEAVASPEIGFGARRFAAIVVENSSAILSCELSTADLRDCRAGTALPVGAFELTIGR